MYESFPKLWHLLCRPPCHVVTFDCISEHGWAIRKDRKGEMWEIERAISLISANKLQLALLIKEAKRESPL